MWQVTTTISLECRHSDTRVYYAFSKYIPLSCFSHVGLFATLRTVAHQAPLSMGFSRQQYWSGLPVLAPGHLPNPGIKPMSPASPALAGDSLPLSHLGSEKVEYEEVNQWSCILSYFCVTFMLQETSSHQSYCSDLYFLPYSLGWLHRHLLGTC